MSKLGEERLRSIQVVTPADERLAIEPTGDETFALALLSIVSSQMHVNPDNITLAYFDDTIHAIEAGAGHTIFTRVDENENQVSGQYFGKAGDRKFLISLERSQLHKPDLLLATLAHEIGHIKILGENLLKENDEFLTDLITVFFGLGIFNANAAFRFFSGPDGWGYNRQGYLSQQEWGYALAIFAYLREEISPAWIEYLSPNIRSDYRISERYIYQNVDKVLV